MKKVDYQTLAQRLQRDVKNPDAPVYQSEYARSLALYLADNLHVNKDEFLKACGVK